MLRKWWIRHGPYYYGPANLEGDSELGPYNTERWERSYLVFWERAKKGFLAEVMSKLRPGGHIRADQTKGQIVQWSPRLIQSRDYQGLQWGGKRLGWQARARMWGAHEAAGELGSHSSMQQGTVGAFIVEIWDDQISIFLLMSWLKGGEWIEGDALEEGRPEECGRRGSGNWTKGGAMEVLTCLIQPEMYHLTNCLVQPDGGWMPVCWASRSIHIGSQTSIIA